MIRYFVDPAGNYIGSFDGSSPPEGSIEVSGPPSYAEEVWGGSDWLGGLVVAQTVKYIEVWAAAESLIDAQANDGVKNPNQSKRLNEKSQKRLAKKSKGRSLAPNEQADEDWYDSYIDWADEVRDKADTSCDAIERLPRAEMVIAYDVSAIAWPTFTP